MRYLSNELSAAVDREARARQGQDEAEDQAVYEMRTCSLRSEIRSMEDHVFRLVSYVE